MPDKFIGYATAFIGHETGQVPADRTKSEIGVVMEVNEGRRQFMTSAELSRQMDIALMQHYKEHIDLYSKALDGLYERQTDPKYKTDNLHLPRADELLRPKGAKGTEYSEQAQEVMRPTAPPTNRPPPPSPNR